MAATIKPIDDLIEWLKGTRPISNTERLKLWEALKKLSDGVFKKGAITTKQVSDSTVVTGGTLEDTLGSLIAGTLTKYTNLWSTDIVFSALDFDTVQWTAGTIKFFDGTSAVMLAGNTGNMVGLTYIVYHPNVSNVALQVYTNYTDSVGDNDRILLCVAKPAVSTIQDAFYVPAIGVFGINETVIGPNSISTSKIQALAITANEIAANTITAAKMNVALLSAISADLGTITAGTVTGATIRTASSGSRIELDSTNGLRAYNFGGILTTQLILSQGFIYTTTIAGITPGGTDQLILTSNDGKTFITLLGNSAGNSAFILINSNSRLAISETAVTVQNGAIFTGDGSGLTTLNGTNISSGTVADARLSSNIPLKNAANTFSAAITMTSVNINFSTGFGIASGGTSVELNTTNGVLMYHGSVEMMRINTTATKMYIGGVYYTLSVVGGVVNAV